MTLPAKHTSNLAQVFQIASRRCQEPRPLGPNTVEVPLAAAAVCAAFSVELALKSILSVEGKPTRVHKLNELFSQLPTAFQAELLGAMSTDRSKFERSLTDVSNVFVEWRYVYELPHAEIDLQFLFRLCEVCQSLSQRVVRQA